MTDRPEPFDVVGWFATDPVLSFAQQRMIDRAQLTDVGADLTTGEVTTRTASEAWLRELLANKVLASIGNVAGESHVYCEGKRDAAAIVRGTEPGWVL